MTCKLSRKYSLSVAVPFIAILTLLIAAAALAQVPSAGRPSGKPYPVSPPPSLASNPHEPLSQPASGQAGPQKVLYTFTGGVDGGQPYAGVIFDSAGNLYGVTQFGGAYGQGTVFKLTPSADGTWTETVVYSFTGGSDGSQPLGGLATDGDNIYGTTAYGGENNDSCGTLFILESSSYFVVLHTFDDLTGDGCQPQADLNWDGSGLLGTTWYGGGPSEQGTVFAWGPGGYYYFWPFQGINGRGPNGLGLVGYGVYGTTQFGGLPGRGNVFELNSPIMVKHVFTSTDKEGYNPAGDLATQVNANGVMIMYGANIGGGVGGRGTIYQFAQSPSNYNVWATSVLHSFSGSDGAYPEAGVVLDAAGNLYGTTSLGGSANAGIVFKLTPVAKNTWTYKVLYSFTGGTDGGNPWSTVVLDSAGNLYGTTTSGGASNQGVVYEVVNTTAAVEPTSLTFGPQPLHTTSPAQRISLLNTSSIPITVTNVNIQGDFAISDNECQSAVQPSSQCDVYVTFTPTGSGTAPRTGAITFVDTAFNSPQSAQLTGTVPYPTKTAVTSSGSPSLVGQSVTFTAKVTPSQGTIPDGELVTFHDGAATLGSVALASGTAAFTTSSLSPKLHTIKATYPGDVWFLSSFSSMVQVVDLYPTTTALSSSLNPSNYGQAVTLTAAVTPTSPYQPTGTVTFKSGSATLGGGTLNTSGIAILTTAKIPAGVDTLTATYNGDAWNGKSGSAITQTVSQAAISMVLTSTPNPSASGKSVKFTARLTSTGGLPSGQPVTFSYNSATLGTANVNSTGVATFSTTTLPQGSDVVTAAYAGSVDYSSASATVTQVVN